ncbi:hypothetical protein VTP01DRAFT_8364 [Rhizomucor pusillus]|uniref:uncharacterized protein n=1 Tax=Rhizomucor pusillus TaxID=4840 RepID=UPI00374202DC
MLRSTFARSKSFLHRNASSLRRFTTDDSGSPFPRPLPTRHVVGDNNKNNSSSSNNNTPNAESSSSSSTPSSVAPILDSVVYGSAGGGRSIKRIYKQHHFDTYSMLVDLERHGFTRRQAHVLMSCIKHRVRASIAASQHRLLRKADMENESYLYKAALSELRTEIQLLRRQDLQLLQAEASAVTHEVESVGQKLNEDIAIMKNEIVLDTNSRKNETRELQQAIDMRIQELNNRLTVRLGDMRTEIEAIRWETIWKTLGK